ncbi:hypothetical protein EVAR_71234_1 [Eumeta japonica]|uniref:Uncharacterized protein n=1 Tax=Eumeta variegata TaxID=151549 RepID=A0A4C1SHE6_EUMVA|nr:hypothetical protein EVAR_71234_1 [Eumeta japonica]
MAADRHLNHGLEEAILCTAIGLSPPEDSIRHYQTEGLQGLYTPIAERQGAAPHQDQTCLLGCRSDISETQAEYVKCLVFAAQQSGLRVVVFNNRGLGGIELKTPRYCASNCEDLSEVVRHVAKWCPKEDWAQQEYQWVV